MDLYQIVDALRASAQNKRLCEVYYSKSTGKEKGKRKRYEVEPYEIKNGGVFVFDPDTNKTKFLLLSKILAAAEITDKQWDVPEDHPRIKYSRKIIGENLEIDE